MSRKRCYRQQPLTRKQQDLARRYVPLARALARPLWEVYPDRRDDLDSAALLGLVHAAMSYDPARGALFSTYVRHRVWGALHDTLRRLVYPKLNRASRSAPGLVPLSMTAEEEYLILSRQNDRPVGSGLETADELEFLLGKLPSQHAAVCREIDLHGKTHREAAKELGWSRSKLSVMRREALELLATLAESPDRTHTAVAV